MMRQMGGRPIARPPMLVAEFTDPVQALTDLIPQLSKLSQANGGPAVTLDKIISQKEGTTLCGGKAATICYQTTRTQNGNSTQYEALDTDPDGARAQGTWMLVPNNVGGPACALRAGSADDAGNAQLIAREPGSCQPADAGNEPAEMAMIRQQGEASQAALTANHQQFMRIRMRTLPRVKPLMPSRCAATISTISSGKPMNFRSPATTPTSWRQSAEPARCTTPRPAITGTADLNYVGGVVDSLNAAANDPNRFVQIPLRDEMYPGAAGREVI